MAQAAAASEVRATQAAAASEVRATRAAAASEVRAARAETRAAQAAAAASDANMRCELRSFSASEVASLSPALHAEFNRLCSCYGVPLPTSCPSDTSQVAYVDDEAPPEAPCPRDGR